MLPFETPTIFDHLPRYICSMPRVVPNQRGKFESDELLKKCARESEVRFTGHRERSLEERHYRFQAALREGHIDLAYVSHGTNLQLVFTPCPDGFQNENLDFRKEPGKVHIRSSFIMNGVCVRWRGWLDLQRLDGVGCLEFDEEHARIEDELLRRQLQRHNEHLRDFDSKHFFRNAMHHGHTDLNPHHFNMHRS